MNIEAFNTFRKYHKWELEVFNFFPFLSYYNYATFPKQIVFGWLIFGVTITFDKK